MILTKQISIMLFLLLLVTSCSTTKKYSIVNYDDNETLSEFRALELDKTHPNVLGSTDNEEEHEKVIQSWISFHQKVGNILAKENFDWETKSNHIRVGYQLYFKPNGQLKYFTYRILNPEISLGTKQSFGEVILPYKNELNINLTRETSYSQCGSIIYPNNNIVD